MAQWCSSATKMVTVDGEYRPKRTVCDYADQDLCCREFGLVPTRPAKSLDSISKVERMTDFFAITFINSGGDYMMSHLAGNPQGPSPSFFSCGPVGCSGTLCVVGLSVLFCVFVFEPGVVLYVAAGAAPSSHG